MSFYVGIDLGTSNTVVSTFENGILKPLKIFNEQAILPSIVLKHQISSSTLAGFKPPKSKYGHDAVQYFLEIYKENRDEEKLRNYQIFSEFKRTLASSSQSANLTKEFLNYILDTIQNSDLQTKTIQSLVVTVPHAWKPESVERQKMQEILNSFKLQNYKLLSEPIAAASYYAYKVKPQKKETILICDLGGGTQDYTLCTISANNQIEVHDNEGSNESGGAIIDDKIREYLISKYGKPLDEHDKFYLKLQSEKLKIQFNKSIEMKLKEEAETESTLAKIMGKIKKLVKNLYNKIANLLQAQKPKQIEFGDSKLELSPNELETATNQVLPQIETHIRNLLNRNPNIQLNKCVLVGGSSNNVFLHAKIRDIVEAEILAFSEEERYMAISYGASLVASG